MNALKVIKSGWLYKLAKFGGVPADGMVTDKANCKFNRLLSAQYDAGEISYAEMHGLKRDPERKIDFCDFTRFVVRGILFGIFCAFLIAILFCILVLPVLDLVIYVICGFLGHGWPQLTGQQSFGVIVSITESVFCVGILVRRYLDEIKTFFRLVFKRKEKTAEYYMALELRKAQSSYDKAEVRKAFIQSLKGKTCFNMEIQD